MRNEEYNRLSESEFGASKEVVAFYAKSEVNPGEEGQKKTGILGTSLNLVSSTIGTGLLGLPLVLHVLGIVPGVIGIILSAFFGIVTGDLLLRCKNITAKENFMGMAEASYKKTGIWIVNICQIITNLGLGINYLIIFGTTVESLVATYAPQCTGKGVSTDPFFCQKWFYSLAVGILVLPFSFAKSMAKLAGASTVKVIAIITFTLITVGYFINNLIKGDLSSDINFLPDVSKPVKVLGILNIVTLSCSYQFNLMPIYRSLERRSDQRIKQCILISAILTLFVYISMALSAFLSFGSKADDLLDSFTKNNIGDVFFIMLNVAFAISCSLSFPVVFFEARNVCYELVTGNATSKDAKDEKKLSTFGYIVMVILLHSFPVAVAVFATSINNIFQLLGSTTMNCFVYLFPCLFYMKLTKGRGGLMSFAIGLLAFGIVMLIFGLWSSVLNFIEEYA